MKEKSSFEKIDKEDADKQENISPKEIKQAELSNKGTSQDHLIVLLPNNSCTNTQRLDEYLNKHSIDHSTFSMLNFSNESKTSLKPVLLPNYSTPKEVSSPKQDVDDKREESVGFSFYSNVDYSEDSSTVTSEVPEERSLTSTDITTTSTKDTSLPSHHSKGCYFSSYDFLIAVTT